MILIDVRNLAFFFRTQGREMKNLYRSLILILEIVKHQKNV